MDEDLKLPDHIAKALESLDHEATRRARAVDAGRVAEAVMRRLKDEPAVTVVRPRRYLSIGIAAAIALLVVSGVLVRLQMAPDDTSLPVAAEITQLDSTQQQALLIAVEAQAASPEAVPAAAVSVDDLDERELEALLKTMEGGEGSL